MILPRIGIEFEKMTPMKLGGYTGLWEGFIKRNYGDENYKTINKMRWLSRRFTDLFEELFKTKISEIGIDFAIDENGHIYLLELNLRRPGFSIMNLMLQEEQSVMQNICLRLIKIV